MVLFQAGAAKGWGFLNTGETESTARITLQGADDITFSLLPQLRKISKAPSNSKLAPGALGQHNQPYLLSVQRPDQIWGCARALNMQNFPQLTRYTEFRKHHKAEPCTRRSHLRLWAPTLPFPSVLADKICLSMMRIYIADIAGTLFCTQDRIRSITFAATRLLSFLAFNVRHHRSVVQLYLK